MEQPPTAAAGVERRAQLRVGVHQRPQLAPARAAVGSPAGRGVQVGDLPPAACEVAELVEVGDLELVLPERGAHGVGHAVHHTGAEAEHGVRVRRGHEQSVHRHRGAQLLGDALDETLGRQPLGGERIDPSRRAGEVPGRARCHGATLRPPRASRDAASSTSAGGYPPRPPSIQGVRAARSPRIRGIDGGRALPDP